MDGNFLFVIRIEFQGERENGKTDWISIRLMFAQRLGGFSQSLQFSYNDASKSRRCEPTAFDFTIHFELLSVFY